VTGVCNLSCIFHKITLKELSIKSAQLKSVLQALLVTFLWSSSFIIIKIGLKEIPPLVFAGLRYVIAFTFLLPLFLKTENVKVVKSLSKKDWIKISALGIIFYSLTQGAQFLGLSLLPSVTVSLILNFTPIVVALMAILFINEYPTVQQWAGTALFICGIVICFIPADLSGGRIIGIIVMLFGVLANAGAAVLGRDINREGRIPVLVITTISMGIGSLLLLIPAIAVQGFPSLSLVNFLLLLWMAVINTAFAFTLWNHTLKTLSAMESSIINGTMLIQIGILAWIFLGEEITVKELMGMVIAATGALLVQIKKRPQS